jgi:hypothetical protein
MRSKCVVPFSVFNGFFDRLVTRLKPPGDTNRADCPLLADYRCDLAFAQHARDSGFKVVSVSSWMYL